MGKDQIIISLISISGGVFLLLAGGLGYYLRELKRDIREFRFELVSRIEEMEDDLDQLKTDYTYFRGEYDAKHEGGE